MDTIGRVEQLAAERELSLFRLSQVCDIPYSTLRNTKKRGGQLTVDTIERICQGLGISAAFFFATEEEMQLWQRTA